MINQTAQFLNWCNTPVGFGLRVQVQLPKYNTYCIFDITGNPILEKGKFLTATEVYQFWLDNKKETDKWVEENL